jgi:hypothetical protein
VRACVFSPGARTACIGFPIYNVVNKTLSMWADVDKNNL